MTNAQAALAQVREAMAAGPTPGPWSLKTVPTSDGSCHKIGPFPSASRAHSETHACVYASGIRLGIDDSTPVAMELLANARLIAACSPANIAAILAHVDAQEAEIERLTAALQYEQHRADRQGTHGDGCADWGPAHYECAIRERDELRRQLAEALAEREAMANVLPGHYYMDPPDGGDVPVLEQLRRMSRDAARYRFLACKGVPPHSLRWSRWRLEYWNGEWWDPLMKEELDAAIDEQIEQERSEQAREA